MPEKNKLKIGLDLINLATLFSGGGRYVTIIVSDKVGAGVDLVKNGYNGFIFPAGDSKALAQSIEKLINFSPEERLLFGQRSKEIITQWVRSCDPVQQILKAIEIAKNIKS